MIAGLSKAATQYLAPLLLLTALLLSTLSFLAPDVILHDQVALLTVTPATSLTGDNANVDGPRIFFGLLGSCSQAHKSAQSNCTSPALNPIYDTGVLPSNAPSLLLSAPATSTPAFIAISLAFLVTFFVSFTFISFHHKMGKFGSVFQKPITQRTSAWVGFLGFFIGLTAFLIVRMWFGKAVQDFNTMMALQEQETVLVAAIGNAFTMAWVAFAFYAIPVVISLAKLNVKSA